MPRIRKKTSRRGTTHQREKIKHKATESRKKAKKEAKRNPQWKSKNPKDPGIPNNFPFKDQVLAEIAEERRKAEEEKTARKEAKKKTKAASKAEPVGDDAEQSDEEAIVDGLATTTIQSSRVKAASKGKENTQEPINEDEATAGVSNPDFPHLQSVLDASDVVIQVLDARDPLSCICPIAEAGASSKKTIYVLNKIDTCPRESLSAWAAHLRRRHPAVYFRAATRFLLPIDNATVQVSARLPADDALGAKAVMSLLTHWAAEQPEGKPLTVAVMGITNVGKSAFINSLARKSASLVYQTPSVGAPSHTPTTTLYPMEVTIDASSYHIRLIDTPGVSFVNNSDTEPNTAEATRAHDILLRSKGRIDRMKNPTPCIAQIVARANQQDLMLFYNLPAYAKDSVDAFLTTIARTQKLTKKGGELDLAAASRVVLRDWAMNKLPRYTIPPKTPEEELDSVPPTANEVHLDDEKTLAQVPTRMERRKTSGVVRLIAASAAAESRGVDLLAPWASDVLGVEAGDDAAEQRNKEEGMDSEEDEEDGGEEDSEASEEEADSNEDGDIDMPSPNLPLIIKGGKRKSTTDAIAPPSKRVQFSRVTVTQSTSKDKNVDISEKVVRKSALKPTKPLPTSVVKTEVKVKAKTGGGKVSVADARKAQRASAVDGSGRKGKKEGLKSANGRGDGAYNFGEFF